MALFRFPKGSILEGLRCFDVKHLMFDDSTDVGYEWADKPHRLVYTLLNQIEDMHNEIEKQRGEKET